MMYYEKYRIVIEGERDFTEEELLQFSNENIFDVVTVLRANEEENNSYKSTKDFNIQFKEI